MRLRSCIAAALAGWLALSASAASARGFAVEDLARMEGVGRRLISPDGRWLVLEHRGAYASAARFDYDRYTDLWRTRLEIVDLARPGPAQALFAAEPGVGYMAGAFSPDGRRLAVYRLKGETWELGIVDVAHRTAHWTGLTPEYSDTGEVLQWISPSRLLVTVTGDGRLPFLFRFLRPQPIRARRWAETATGGAALTRVGSGRYARLNPRDPPKRLLRYSVDRGAVETLASGDITDFEVAPGARRVAWLEAGEDIPLSSDRPIQGAYGIAVRRQRLRILDLQSGAVTRPCETCDALAQLLSWDARGDRLLVYVRAFGAPWSQGRLAIADDGGRRVADIDTGAVDPLVLSRPEVVRAGWFAGDPIAFGRRRDDPGPPGWWRLGSSPTPLTPAGAPAPLDGLVVTRSALLVPSSGEVLRVAREGTARAIPVPGFAPLFPFREGLMRRHGWAFAERSVAAGSASAGETSEAVEIDPAGAVERHALPRGATLLEDVPGRGRLVRLSAGGGADQLVWVGPDGRSDPIASINPQLRDVDRPIVTPVRHPGPAGEPLTSWILSPPHADPAHPPPLVVWPYLGQSYPKAPDLYVEARESPGLDGPRLLVGHGYAVLLPSLPAPNNGSLPDEGLAARVLGIVDSAAAAAQTRRLFDPARLGVWGHSFGGYSTLALIGQTDRFGAAVAVASISDLFEKWGDFGPYAETSPENGLATSGYTEDLQPDMRGPPWRTPARYLAGSPALQLDHAKTPLLLVHGDIDGIQLSQSEQAFSVYQRDHKDAMLITYWGEGHMMRSPLNMADYFRSALAWMDDHLGVSGR